MHPVRYTGSKNGSGIFQNIINIMPKHDIYIEPFLGSGAILKIKDTARVNIGIDISSSIIKNFVTGHGNFFLAADTFKFLDASAPLLNALRYLGLKALIYCDPPYPLSTRRSGSVYYKNEMSDLDHKTFLSLVRNLNCYVMISTYDNPIYQDMINDWNVEHFATVTRKGKAIESVYYNFSPDLPKHQFNFLGKNFRERAAIKGRVFRNVSKILSMSAAERNYIMDLLSKKV
jgi:site-specific DNA-adenine methylase